jgi:hypothetical protein
MTGLSSIKVQRVFLLGAGASKSWGLPLTNELFPLALKDVPKREDRTLIRNFIRYQYPHFHRGWHNYPLFEEFLSLVDVYLDFADVIKRSHSFKIEDVERIREELLLAIPAVLHGARAKAAHPRVRKFAALLQPGDAVVSFNWDLLVEEALDHLGKDWEYSLREDAISILKPHGSLDWFDSNDVATIKKDLLFPLNRKYKRILVFRRFRAPQISPVVPVILPPVINKKIDYKELQSIWRDAWRALRYATEIYILGYSLPPEDLHARFAIRSAIRGNEKLEGHKLRIAVVNPDRNVYLRFARLVEGSVKYYESGLQGISLAELVAGA